MIARIFPRLFPILCVVSLLLPAAGLAAQEEISILLTSNLQGKFLLDEQDPDRNDPLLAIAQGMLAERKARKIHLYLDLGNAFYPGSLSKFSFGAIVMDYFNCFFCDATLVSSKDLQIGLDNLEGQRKDARTKLLSANLLRDAKPLFDPYMLYATGRSTLAVLGVSSTSIRFDIAEKKLYTIRMEEGFEKLAEPLAEIREKGASQVLLLSGLSLKDTISLLDAYKQIGMAICGGDNTGELYGGQAVRVEMADGRPIVLLPQSDGYYVLDLLIDSRLSVRNLAWKSVDEIRQAGKADAKGTADQACLDFLRSLYFWKKQFRKEEDKVVASIHGRGFPVHDENLSFLLRDLFNAEVSVVDRHTMVPSTYEGEVKHSQILDTVNLDYSIFVYDLTGEQIQKILDKDETLLVNGITNQQIQGYPIEDKRRYRVASSQPAYEKIARLLGKEVSYRNTWQTVSELLLADLEEKKVLFKDDHRYLDRRFRTTVDIRLSNFLDHSTIDRGGSITPPPGQPAESYKKWGLNDRIDLTLYNNRHQFILTPEILYQRQDDQFLQNLLRGTFIYNLNVHSVFKPYHKSQFDTVLEQQRSGFRPMLLRETIGVSAAKGIAKGRLGLGFEKRINDPVEPARYGLEAIGNVKVPFWDYFTYVFDLDSFFAVESFDGENGQVRSEIENGLSFAFNRYVGLSLKHRWFYYYSGDVEEDYSDSQFLTSLDLGMDFKIW